jgi:hypothetical protein
MISKVENKKKMIKKYFNEAKLYFNNSNEFPKIMFVSSKFFEEDFKKNNFGVIAMYDDEINTVTVLDFNLKRKEVNNIIWKAVIYHELTHWYYRKKNFKNCHNKLFATKLLSIYFNIFKDKKTIFKILKKEKWSIKTKFYQAFSVYKKYDIL